MIETIFLSIAALLIVCFISLIIILILMDSAPLIDDDDPTPDDHVAHIEHLSGVARVFSPGDQYGDPFIWSCAIRWIDNQTIEIVGALTSPTIPQWRAFRVELERLGVNRILVVRFDENGVRREKWKTFRRLGASK